MKLGLRLFAVLAIGAVPMAVAVAGHHGLHSGGSTAAGHVGTNPQNVKTPLAAGSQPGGGPPVQGGIADHTNGGAKDRSVLTGADKAVADDTGFHTGSAKTGISANTATPAPSVVGKPGDAGVPIDTRITVHEGHEAIRANKDGLFKKRKAPIIPGIALPHERINNLHQASPVGSNGSPHRNAIGTVVERDKTVEHAIGTAGGAIVPPTNVGPQRIVATLRDHNAGTASDKASMNPRATASGNHISAADDALKVVANGQSISGTAMIRPEAGVGAIGGPTKIATGRINGSSFRPKHL